MAHSLSQTILSPFRQALIITTKGLDHNLPRTKLFDVATSHLFPVQSLQNGNIHLLKRWGSKIDETTSLRKFSCSSTSVVFPVGCCLKGSHSNNYSPRKIINDSLHLIYLLECRRREKDQTEILRKTNKIQIDTQTNFNIPTRWDAIFLVLMTRNLTSQLFTWSLEGLYIGIVKVMLTGPASLVIFPVLGTKQNYNYQVILYLR